MVYRTWVEHADHHATDPVYFDWWKREIDILRNIISEIDSSPVLNF